MPIFIRILILNSPLKTSRKLILQKLKYWLLVVFQFITNFREVLKINTLWKKHRTI